MINNHVLALDALGESINTWNIILILILTKKLDSATFKKWDERLSEGTTKPRLSQFIEFLKQQAKVLERTVLNK